MLRFLLVLLLISPAAAESLGPEVLPAPVSLPDPPRKNCRCTPECVCGCQSGLPCDCPVTYGPAVRPATPQVYSPRPTILPVYTPPPAYRPAFTPSFTPAFTPAPSFGGGFSGGFGGGFAPSFGGGGFGGGACAGGG